MNNKGMENVAFIDGVPNMVKISKKDAQTLHDSIVDFDVSKAMFEEAKKDGDKDILSTTMRYHLKSAREHQSIWLDMLDKYVGEEYASMYGGRYRYDKYRKVIFLFKDAECQSCSS